jgi:hypothetical protein
MAVNRPIVKTTELFVAEIGVVTASDLVQVAADGRGVSGAADRQNILQQIRCHAVGHQRGPAGLQVKQFRGDASVLHGGGRSKEAPVPHC